MKITLAPVGTASDVLPMLALAKALHNRGHIVTLCAAEEFRSLVYKTGFQMVSNGQTYRNYLEAEGTPDDASKELATILSEDMAMHFVALRDSTRHADVIVGGRLQIAGPSFAEQLKIPYVYFETTPGATDYDRYPIFGVAQDRLQKRRKRLKEWDEFVLSALNRERKLTHLPPVTNLFEYLYRSGDILIALDPAIAAVKTVLNQSVTGFCFYEEEWNADPDLEAFLDQGNAPIYIAPFRTKDPFLMASLCNSLTKEGHRVVLGYGWPPEMNLPSGCVATSSLTYAQTFPKISLVVHAGASDVTAHAIRSRVPQVVLPYTAEQTYWAKRARELGVSPAPTVPVDAVSIYQGVQEALKLRQQAESIPAVENGAELAASMIENVAERHQKVS
jgi:sterol 3beta-glucosyltransferase